MDNFDNGEGRVGSDTIRTTTTTTTDTTDVGGSCKKTSENLRVEIWPSHRISQPFSVPNSPQPSVDRLSVSFAAEEDKSFSEYIERPSPSLSSKFTFLNMAEIESSPIPTAGGSGMRLSITGASPVVGTDEDDDYSASVTAILHRRSSNATKKTLTVGKRRTSSPFDNDRRRSSIFTTSSGDTAITMEGQEGEITQEQIFENIRLHKEVLESVKQQPWEMRRKIKLVQQAKEYVRRHEGHLQERLAQSKSTKDFMASFNIVLSRWWQYLKREFGNFAVNLIPWELRIKEIESHFGSVVASYFTFLRWVFWINIVMTAIIICLIIVPEVLAADPQQAGMRKKLQDYEERTSTHLNTLWDFEGILKYSPMFYGFYTTQDYTTEGYPLPLSYFLTGLGIYVYSFVAILRRMAKNSRQSKLSEKDDECIFSWKVFTGWDFMIGNPETAFNRFASVTMGFKEALLEEKEKTKDERNWRVVSMRILANLLVIILLMFSAYAVVLVVDKSKTIHEKVKPSWIEQNEITLVMSLITTIFPNLFELIGILEKYHPRKQLRLQLARIMVLNFLNLYTLMFALFGKVSNMTERLEKLRPSNATMVPITVPSYVNYCVDISVNCALLNEYRYNQTVKETTEILTFLTEMALATKYYPNGTLSLDSFTRPWIDPAWIDSEQTTNETMSGRFNQREWWNVLHSVIPKLDRLNSSFSDLIISQSEVEDNENLTLYTRRLSINDTLNLIPGNETTLKVALPLLLKLVLALVPQRSFQQQSTSFVNITQSTTSSPDLITWTELFSTENNTSTTASVREEVNMTESTTSVTFLEIINMSSSPQDTWGYSTFTTMSPTPNPILSTSTEKTIRRLKPSPRMKINRNFTYNQRHNRTKDTIWRNVRHVTLPVDKGSISSTGSEGTDVEGEDTNLTDDKMSNNLLLTGRSSSRTVVLNKLSTRGDIPGDASESDYTSTTQMPTITTNLMSIPEDSQKLLTRIVTTIQFIANHNSSRMDFPSLSTIDEYAVFLTNYSSHAETRVTTDLNKSNFSSSFKRKSNETETSKCFIKACENGTTDPPNLIEFLNCTDMLCAMNILVGPKNKTTNPECIIPGSRSCMTTTGVPPTTNPLKNKDLGKLCWETMFGQELVKLTVMDLIFTVAVILVLDFIRAILVRVLNPCWCWDLEKKFPQYGDFKIAENILHLVNNQGMIWMGLFFSPGLPAINLVKLVILMYIRSWTVMTCNVPHETVFRASRSNNFYFALLLFMLFLCVLPVGYAIVWLRPSWHCGPFSKYQRIYHIFTTALMDSVPVRMHNAIDYIASPGIIIPLLVLLVLVIYYLLSLTSSLREANNDLKIQLRRERTEERRKMFKMAGGKDKDTALSRWQAIIPTFQPKHGTPRVSILTSGKQTGFAGLAKRATLKAREISHHSRQSQAKHKHIPGEDDGNATDVDQISLPDDIMGHGKKKSESHTTVVRKPSATDSILSRSEIPVIKISKEDEGIMTSGRRSQKIDKPQVAPKPILEKKIQDPEPSLLTVVPPSQSEEIPSSSSVAFKTQRSLPPADISRKERIKKALINRAKAGRGDITNGAGGDDDVNQA